MASIHLFRRKRKRKDGTEYRDKYYTAEIQLGRQAKFQRGTGCTSQRDAKTVARRFLKQAEEKLEVFISAKQQPDMTIDQLFGGYVSEYVSTLRSRETALIRLDQLLKYLEARTVLQIKPEILTNYIFKRRSHGSSNATINRELTQLRAALNYGHKSWDLEIPKIDWKHFSQSEPKERIVLEKQEDVQAIFNHLPCHIRQCALFCYYTGCRLNAMETLVWQQVNFKTSQAVMLNKGGNLLPFALSDQAVVLLEQVAFNDYRLKGDRVFNTTNRRRHWEDARKKANMEHFIWHDIRHFTATSLSNQGTNSRTIQKILKHSDISTTEKYTHVNTESARKALNTLPIME